MSYIDVNVDNYTIYELYSILNNPQSIEQIINRSDKYIEKYKKENNKNMYNFFIGIKTKLVENFYENDREDDITNSKDRQENINDDDYNDEYKINGEQYIEDKNENNDDEYKEQTVFDKQTNKWLENAPALNQVNKNQLNKITNRKQKINVYQDGRHYPMSRQQLGVNNTFDVPVSQDKLNPRLENISTRLIVLDSLYRQASNDGENSSSSDYVCDLSDQLRNVLSLRLYSYQIPFSWYIIDKAYGNACFWIYNNLNYFEINISSGNYNPTTFIDELMDVMDNVGFLGISNSNIYYTLSTGKITINLNGITDPSGNVINGVSEQNQLLSEPRLIFFDFTHTLNCTTNTSCSASNYKFNNTLGWIMGFRTSSENILIDGNTGHAIFDYYGPKYFVLIIDDYNQNHVNNGLVTITELSTKLNVPSYFNSDISYICEKFNNTRIANTSSILNNDNDLYINSEKVYDGTKTIPQIIPNAPRTITNSQIYTINEIIKNNNKNTRFKVLPANPNDSFAIISLEKNNLSLGQFITENSSSLQTNKRVYFGPVNIERMRIKLIDDKGNIINLNGLDWNIVLIAETLYQY